MIELFHKNVLLFFVRCSVQTSSLYYTKYYTSGVYLDESMIILPQKSCVSPFGYVNIVWAEFTRQCFSKTPKCLYQVKMA